MDELKTQVQRLIDAGVPEPEIGSFIQKHSQNISMPQLSEKTTEIDTYSELGLPVGNPEMLGEYGAPLLEGAGLVGGALAGSFAGPAGSAGGAALGYGMAKQIEQLAGEYLGDRETLKNSTRFKQAAKDLTVGAALEVGGQLAGKLIFEPIIKGGKWLFSTVKSSFTGEGGAAAIKQASKVWTANTSAGPIYAKNKQEAETLEGMIPGLKFTEGQKTFDPAKIRFERTAFRKGDAGVASVEQQASNDVALKAYYQKEFGGKEGVDDFIKALNGKHSEIQNNVETLKKAGAIIESELEGGDIQTIHKNIIERLRTNKKIVHKKAEDLYKLLPEGLELDTKNLMSEYEAINQKTIAAENPDNIPSIYHRIKDQYAQKVPEELKALVDGFRKKGQPVPQQLLELEAEYGASSELSFKEVKGIRTEILNEKRIEQGLQNANPAKIKRLNEMLESTERALDQLAESGDENVREVYKSASKLWRFYRQTYESGTVGDILKVEPKSGELKLTPEQSLSKIFNSKDLRAADRLNIAIGKNNAKQVVKEYADYDLITKTKNPITGEVDSKKLTKWLQTNSKVLDKYGIKDSYKSLETVKEAISIAETNLSQYEKSQAMKILGADVDKAIKTAFTGKGGKASAETAKELLNIAKGNPAAQAGIKRAFTDNILDEITVTAKEITGTPTTSVAKFNNVYKKYEPALKEFYKGEPKKIKALQNMKKSYEIMIRNKTSPIGGGSDTFENTISALYQATGHTPVGGPIKWRAMRSILRIVTSFKQAQVEQVLSRAIFDPDVAMTLEMIANGTKTEIVQKRFSDHIISLVGLAGKQTYEELQ